MLTSLSEIWFFVFNKDKTPKPRAPLAYASSNSHLSSKAMTCERCRWGKESAVDAVQAHAAAWAAANHSDSSGSGNHFHELSSGGTASQPGVLSSLSKNGFGYAKGTPSEQATTCPTAGGYEGSQSSMPDRQLYHIDVYTPDPEFGVAPGGRA